MAASIHGVLQTGGDILVGSSVEYRVSNYNSEYVGYWWGDKITLYAPGLWQELKTKDEEHFIKNLVHTVLVETICRVKAHEHSGIRVKGGRCNLCMPSIIADFMLFPDEWGKIREHYRNQGVNL